MALWHRWPSLAYLAVFIGVLGHASTEFVAVTSGVAGPELSVWRFVLGGSGLVVLALLFPGSRDLVAPFRTHAWPLLGLSLLGVTFGYLVFHWSLDFASVVQVATMVTTIPIWVALINLAVNRQPIGLPKIVSGLCALAGITLLLTDGYMARLAGDADSLIGVALALLCGAAVAAYSVLARPIIVEYGALRVTAITMFLGAMALWVLVGVSFDVWVQPARLGELPLVGLVSLLAIAFWNTTITQFLWIGGLAAVPDITRGSYLFFLKPVIAVLLYVLILGQSMTAIQILAVLVVTGSVLGEMLAGRLTRRPGSSS